MKGVVLIAALVSGCAVHHEPSRKFASLQLEAKSLCEVMANPRLYVKQRVMIKGIYVREPHQRVLYDADCPQWDFRVSHAFTVDGDPTAERLIKRAAKQDPTVSIPVIYYGTLAARVVIVGCTEPSCHSYSLQDAQLLAASPKR